MSYDGRAIRLPQYGQYGHPIRMMGASSLLDWGNPPPEWRRLLRKSSASCHVLGLRRLGTASLRDTLEVLASSLWKCSCVLD